MTVGASGRRRRRRRGEKIAKWGRRAEGPFSFFFYQSSAAASRRLNRGIYAGNVQVSWDVNRDFNIDKRFSGFTAGFAETFDSTREVLFWWKVMKNALPTNECLEYRRLQVGNLCSRGCLKVENIEHIVVNCRILHEVIAKLSEWGIILPKYDSLSDCLKDLKKNSKENLAIVRIYYSLDFHTWKATNDVKHGNSVEPPICVTIIVLLSSRISHLNPTEENWDANQLRSLFYSLHPLLPN
ncbi:hypothetical protein M5K25_004673 [Dendrobium thyrsiflorum]|uniref:Reverse transcriptase zinc-binding domain-containing protein n=1 Tax=Dendrobium thyrsiflorum TaxID=117978 RepID=A0ABD0VMU6_DENTH